MSSQEPYVTIRSRRPAETNGMGSVQGSGDFHTRSATHDISRTSFHIKHVGQFARRLEESAIRAFPNRGRTSQRYKNVQALLLHWGCDDLFVLPELEDLERCLREDYSFGTDIFPIPSENSHLELMLKLGQLIKQYESDETLFIVYYGGHARIDESRQSTWCATRESDSPWLQWSAIQTLLERSKSDVLILLDCCAGAASATFPTGNSITETISASSWDAIAPDPGRYSFTNALIEVLQEWRMRTFSAAMLHAEVLARLKHPRPVTINGKLFEARSTPVHFMMTSNHKAPSIEFVKLQPIEKDLHSASPTLAGDDISGRASVPTVADIPVVNEPNEDTPHVMISLALEADQRLDINAWEQWLNAFPALAKYVKVQGVFKSHSTLLLVSMPVTIWDLLPEDHATSFVAFIRSNNLAMQNPSQAPTASASIPIPSRQDESIGPDSASFVSGVSGTTFAPTENIPFIDRPRNSRFDTLARDVMGNQEIRGPSRPGMFSQEPREHYSPSSSPQGGHLSAANIQNAPERNRNVPSTDNAPEISRQMIVNQQQSMRRTIFDGDVPQPKKFSSHVERRLEDYYRNEPLPNDGQSAFIASNLGVELWHVEVWFHHRRQQELVANRLAGMRLDDRLPSNGSIPRMILPADISRLLETSKAHEVLLFDLRSHAEYQKSHIQGAINFRIPKSFMETATFDMILQTISLERDRAHLSRWRQARCLVFYSRNLESSWECPSATLMFHKLLAQGWEGQSFILKGHYREFSSSFGQFTTQSITTESEANANTASDSKQKAPRMQARTVNSEADYASWLLRIDSGQQSQSTAAIPSPERAEIVDALEQELETEFQARFGKEMIDSSENKKQYQLDNFDTKAQMVEFLDRGLAKVRNQEVYTSWPHSTYNSEDTKAGSDNNQTHFEPAHDEADGYVEVNRADEFIQRSEPKLPTESEETLKRGRGGGFLNKVFKR